MQTGKVKFFAEDRGFGFIVPSNGGPDVFVHVTDVVNGDDLAVGDTVSFDIGENPRSKRPKAIGVKLLSEGAR